MRANQWIVICLALSVMLYTGIAVAQEESISPYPIITPDNVAQVQEVQRLGNSTLGSAMAWAPDGSQLAVGGYDNGFWLYSNLAQDATFYPLDHIENAVPVMFVPQGDLLLLSNRQHIVAYDLARRAPRYSLDGIRPLAFSHSGDWLAYEVDDGVRISQVATGATVFDLSYVGMRQWPAESEPEDTYTQRNSIVFAQFLPDDNRLLVRWQTFYSATWESIERAGYDIWSLTGASPSVAAVEDLYGFVPPYPDLLAILPDGQLFAIKENAVVTENGEHILSPTPARIYYDPPTYAVQNWTVAFPYRDPDIALILVGVWDVRTGEQIGQLPASSTLALSPDGSQIVSGTTVYDVATGGIVARLQHDNYEILPGTNRILHLGADNTLHLLDTANLADIATLDLARSDMIEIANRNYSYVISPETHTILFRTQGFKRWVRINLENGATLAVFETSDTFTNYVIYTPDNRYLITGIRSAGPHDFALWDVASGQLMELPSTTRIVPPVLVPHGWLILWDYERFEVILYDVAAASPVMTFPFRSTRDDPNISFSPTNTYLVSTDNQGFVVWDQQTGEIKLQVEDALYPSFSSDDKFLVYQRDLRVEVISVPAGELIWQTDLDYMIYAPEFVTNSVVRIDPLWPELGEPIMCYDITTGIQDDRCIVSGPFAPKLEIGDMQFFGGGLVIDLAGEKLAQLEMPYYVFHMALSSDQTRIWTEYSDGTLGVWAVVSPE